MNKQKYNLLLADDDDDDRIFFKEALEDLLIFSALETVNDGVHLMDFLYKNESGILPDILFLDLNMPRKSGLECLLEIRQIENLKHLPIIIFSTSYDKDIINLLYKNGANLYVQKPCEFSKLKMTIQAAITNISKNKYKQPLIENFILKS